jgi:modulator of FtsH protease
MYATTGWENFFVAEAGASAALLGLLFVAVSINLTRVLQFPHLPGRAAEALAVLVGVLVSATCGLIPGQSPQLLGIELFVLGAIAWILPLPAQYRHARAEGTRLTWVIYRVASTQAATLPVLVAGASLYVERGGGLYWLVPAVIFSFANAVIGGWVLLIEIQR